MSSATLETSIRNLVTDTGGFAGTRRNQFPKVKPPGYFSPDADPVAVKAFYEANGFLVLENAFSPAEIDALKQETTHICRGDRGALPDHPNADPAEPDDSVLQRFLCIHFPHKCSDVMLRAIHNQPSVKTLANVVSPNVKCMQSMLFIKASGKPGQAWHQDEDYIPTRDRSLVGVWISMDRATTENGCLWVLPGSHQHGIIWDQHWHADRRFDCAEESEGFPYTDEESIPVQVEPGSVVFFNGYLLHRSLPNTAPTGTYRRALVNHYMSCESRLPWGRPPEGVSTGRFDHRDIIIVAGKDPYAHKGYEQIHTPSVRPSGEGGCDKWGGKGKQYKDAIKAEVPAGKVLSA
jgi:phytanoyl-CoA hydroxylase